MKRALLVLFVLALAAWATPNLISYQGKLDKDGEPFSGEASMNFALYESEDATTSFWEETQTVIVVDGIFNVLLGSVTELPALPTDGCWLEVVIDGDALPRQQITSVPYAQVADQAYSHFKMVEDTAMDYDCPADGILLVGYWIQGAALYRSVHLYVDDMRVAGWPGNNIESFICTAIAIEEGSHRIRITVSPGATITDVRLWAIFMR
ncbi:hypothetical protein CEE36_05015 [candidate division TA06 bacterium B3_TA06]|uniref:Uncharacterized protein n=1 Tax=candidate division TA06 bacterium B3_TA06 TaxID=2012487 RepID=A0A532V7E2_UNCT6|nr:MAG: hypothetical protein CEE36_05015 [candidate division TA06 bacterium B3_TA06]